MLSFTTCDIQSIPPDPCVTVDKDVAKPQKVKFHQEIKQNMRAYDTIQLRSMESYFGPRSDGERVKGCL